MPQTCFTAQWLTLAWTEPSAAVTRRSFWFSMSSLACPVTCQGGARHNTASERATMHLAARSNLTSAVLIDETYPVEHAERHLQQAVLVGHFTERMGQGGCSGRSCSLSFVHQA